MENCGGMISTGENFYSSLRALANLEQSRLVAKQEELSEVYEFSLRSIFVHISK
jgi:hypothetical protein